MSKTVSDDAPFGANSPFFLIIKEGLEALLLCLFITRQFVFGLPELKFRL